MVSRGRISQAMDVKYSFKNSASSLSEVTVPLHSSLSELSLAARVTQHCVNYVQSLLDIIFLGILYFLNDVSGDMLCNFHSLLSRLYLKERL